MQQNQDNLSNIFLEDPRRYFSIIGLDSKDYDSLSEKEKEAVKTVINESLIKNNDQAYDQLYLTDYDEIPVSFKEFISNDFYLGKSTRHGDAIYPFWQNEGEKIFAKNEINEVALSGSIGVGKTTSACIMMAYHLYKTMCLKNPQQFFNLTPGSVIAYAFINNTLESSKGVGFGTIQSFVKESDWFLKHGRIVGRSELEYQPDKGFGFVVGSKPQHTLGRHVISSLLDEVSFAPGQNVSYEKSKIMSVYTNIRRRMDSRFMVQGKNYGLMFLVSSKATESSFLEAYIADQVKKNYPIYVVDKPLWDIKPAAYSGKRFKVAVGNKYIQSRIIDDTENLDEVITSLKAQGLRIIDVPIEHRQAFDQNLDKALQDIAGISTSTVTKAFSGLKIEKCISEELENPFYTDIVTIGTHDELKLQDFFDRNKIPDSVKNSPIFIHLDASVSGDRTGLSAVGIAGSKKQLNYGADVGEEHTSEELIFQQVFSIGIQAPSSDEISFEKTRQFIYWLRDEVGLNIVLVSTDGFQSVDTRQILSSKGFEVGYTSLDRTPDGYDGLRSAINDGRIILLQGCKTLKNELTELERDNMTRKYDHPISGCFTGDTKIKLVDGRSLTILELLKEQEYKQNWVYTFNEITKKIEPKPIKKVFQTKITSDLVKVTLDNGESIVCTPDHRFMLRDGSYEEARNIPFNTSLMTHNNQEVHTRAIEININKFHEVPVYDLEIEDNHNFALEAGVIVHNSKDIADSLAGAFLDASNYKDEYLYFNPIDESFEDLNVDRDDKKDLINDMTKDLLGVNTSNFSINDVNASIMNFGYDDPSIVII